MEEATLITAQHKANGEIIQVGQRPKSWLRRVRLQSTKVASSKFEPIKSAREKLHRMNVAPLNLARDMYAPEKSTFSSRNLLASIFARSRPLQSFPTTVPLGASIRGSRARSRYASRRSSVESRNTRSGEPSTTARTVSSDTPEPVATERNDGSRSASSLSSLPFRWRGNPDIPATSLKSFTITRMGYIGSILK